MQQHQTLPLSTNHTGNFYIAGNLNMLMYSVEICFIAGRPQHIDSAVLRCGKNMENKAPQNRSCK